jgi:hypothetical protein
MKKWILALAVAALAVPGLAEEKTAIVAYQLDLEQQSAFFPADVPDLMFCRTLGRGGDPFAPDYEVVGNFRHNGNTIIDLNGSNAFLSLLPGDLITLRQQDQIAGTTTEDFTTVIDAWFDPNQVDVVVAAGAARDYSKLYYRVTQCGDPQESRQFPGGSPGEITTSFPAGAWVNVLNWESVTFSVHYQSGSIPNGLAFTFECRTRDATLPGYSINAPRWGQQIYPGPSSACGYGSLNTDVCVLPTPEDAATGRAVESKFALQISDTQNFYECRIGLGCDDTCAGAGPTRVNASITVNRQEVK